MTQPNRLWQCRARTCRRWQSESSAPNDVFDRTLAVDGFSQNRGKEGSSCIWWEWALSQIVVWCVTARFRCQAKSSQWARHLGSHLGEKASFTHELPRRRQATMAAFYSVGQLWYESRVSWRLKRCFFISRVVNTAFSGIEAFCPSKAQLSRLW